MFEQQELPFGLSLAERYMKIARELKSADAQNLPSPVMTLYALSKLSDEVFDQAVADGKINPATTQKEAVALRTKPPLAATILIRIEDQIAELTEVTRDQVDDDCRKQARKLGERLFAWAADQLRLQHFPGSSPVNL